MYIKQRPRQEAEITQTREWSIAADNCAGGWKGGGGGGHPANFSIITSPFVIRKGKRREAASEAAETQDLRGRVSGILCSRLVGWGGGS